MEAPIFGGSDSTVQEPTETVEPPSESLASPFLENIPAQDRDVVGRYVKDWDAQVTKKFQEYAGKVKPYEALGSAEDLMRMKNFADNFRRDPETIFRLMFQNLHEQYGDEFDTKLFEILQLEAEETMDGFDSGQEYGNEVPDPNQVFQQNVSSELEEIRAWKAEQQAAVQSAEEEKQLAGFLETMHTQFGAFDDDWVLLRLGEHGDPKKAISQWNEFLTKLGGNPETTSRQPPKVMGGQGGGVPSQQVDPTKLNPEDRRKLVQAMLGE